MINYNSDFYNEIRGDEQWIRLTDGCYRNCWNCYCPKKIKVYDLPKIQKNKVRFLDMNFLYAHPDPVGLLNSLPKKFKGRVIRYSFLCGLDFTLLTPEIATALVSSRVGWFTNKGVWKKGVTLAWDREVSEYPQIIRSVILLTKAGYSKKNISVFMLCNGKISFSDCWTKLKVLKMLRVQVKDCWFDNQIRGSIKPIYWENWECKEFGRMCRSHNIAILQNMYDSIEALCK